MEALDSDTSIPSPDAVSIASLKVKL